MPEYREIELHVAMDADGDYGVGTDAEAAGTNYTETISSDGWQIVRRLVVKLKVEVPEPTVLTATVPCKESAATLTVS